MQAKEKEKLMGKSWKQTQLTKGETKKSFDASKRNRWRRKSFEASTINWTRKIIKKFEQAKDKEIEKAWKLAQLHKEETEKVLIQAIDKEIEREKFLNQAQLHKEVMKDILMQATEKEIER